MQIDKEHSHWQSEGTAIWTRRRRELPYLVVFGARQIGATAIWKIGRTASSLLLRARQIGTTATNQIKGSAIPCPYPVIVGAQQAVADVWVESQ